MTARQCSRHPALASQQGVIASRPPGSSFYAQRLDDLQVAPSSGLAGVLLLLILIATASWSSAAAAILTPELSNDVMPTVSSLFHGLRSAVAILQYAVPRYPPA